jgi:hypothetical protein
MERYLVFAAVACLYCSPGLAQIPVTDASAPQATTPNDHDPNRIVCKTVDIPGSKIDRRRACGPQSEWDARQRIDREWVEGIQRGVKNGF